MAPVSAARKASWLALSDDPLAAIDAKRESEESEMMRYALSVSAKERELRAFVSARALSPREKADAACSYNTALTYSLPAKKKRTSVPIMSATTKNTDAKPSGRLCADEISRLRKADVTFRDARKSPKKRNMMSVRPVEGT